eukprot:CAMPEP_0113482368 /NCGR_PEP_ID=MMETSP0014_2-20120614/22882_1 /TAXON_ID=2857 /ORGANISM="Nitzschia sp." /LENGTH=353 /DNA_ID=CAMNT_0000375881 /DNA_START=69 /DNA_END=1130 /DNA_ORIENTATION=+ /assembly_acc=CAM_ASM_000159
MRLTQESQGRLTSSSAHAAPATAMLQGPLRRKISLELKAWEDSLAAAAGNSSFSSFNKNDDDDEENDRDKDFADENYDGSSCSTDDDDQLVVRQKKDSRGKKSKSSKKTKKAVKIISRKNADGSIIKNQESQRKQQQQQEPREQEQPLAPPKSVSFYPRVRIRRIRCLDDTDDETIYNMYYSPEELEDIRDGLRESIRSYIYSSSSSDNNTDIRSVESEDDEVDDTVVVDVERMMVDEESDSDDSDDDSFCLRGLENELPENKQRRRLTKSAARKAVLQEQERQRQEGYNDVYQVSFVYKRQVGSSTQSAFLAASRDAWDAKKIREEEESYEASSCEAYDRESHYFEDITVQS